MEISSILNKEKWWQLSITNLRVESIQISRVKIIFFNSTFEFCSIEDLLSENILYSGNYRKNSFFFSNEVKWHFISQFFSCFRYLLWIPSYGVQRISPHSLHNTTNSFSFRNLYCYENTSRLLSISFSIPFLIFWLAG